MENTFVVKGEAPESDTDTDEDVFDSENKEVIAKVCCLFPRKWIVFFTVIYVSTQDQENNSLKKGVLIIDGEAPESDDGKNSFRAFS